MITRLSLFLVAISVSFSANAEISAVRALPASTGLPGWIKIFSQKVSAKIKNGSYDNVLQYTECAEITEQKSAFLCLSQTQTEMNQSLARASIFVEGLNTEPGTVVDRNSESYRTALAYVGGHDLRKADLLRFYKAAQNACQKDSNLCFDENETEIFEQFILPLSQKLSDFVVITFANESIMSWVDVATHEILHSQYFLNPTYLSIVDNFWEKEITEQDKIGITRILSRTYNVADKFLLKNEFQAYLLMQGAESSYLYRYLPKYRQKLLDELVANGVSPIQVHGGTSNLEMLEAGKIMDPHSGRIFKIRSRVNPIGDQYLL